ncbi:MAG: hypothetical protein ACI4L8_05565, partial [Candidatus Fimadaptatus sp.]
RITGSPSLRVVGRRLLAAIPVLIGVTLLTFTVMSALPNTTAQAILGLQATPSAVAALNHTLGLDQPFWQRYGHWLNNVLHGNLLGHETIELTHDSDTLPLKYDYFAVDAIVLRGVNSRAVTLRTDLHGRAVRVEFPGFDYLLFWTKPNAPYICIEPWCNFQDWVDADKDITHKPGVIALQPGERRIHTHTIEFIG